MKLLTILFVNVESKNNKLKLFIRMCLMEENIYAANGSLQK